jgi:transposase
MLICGIDIAKQRHEASLVDESGKLLSKSLKFTNDSSGAAALIEYISKLNQDNQDIIFGMEATGHYWLALYSFLFDKGYTVNVINPIQTDALRNVNTCITTIPGIGPVLGATIISEIGDFSTFTSAEKLVAFAGIDPSVMQSGNFEGTRGKMSKRGSPHLRRALWLAAQCAAMQEWSIFRAYYLKKISEGKHHYTAIGAVARKLTYTIFAVLRDNKPYVPIA